MPLIMDTRLTFTGMADQDLVQRIVAFKFGTTTNTLRTWDIDPNPNIPSRNTILHTYNETGFVNSLAELLEVSVSWLLEERLPLHLPANRTITKIMQY